MKILELKIKNNKKNTRSRKRVKRKILKELQKNFVNFRELKCTLVSKSSQIGKMLTNKL
jgi:hypothetical protein